MRARSCALLSAVTHCALACAAIGRRPGQAPPRAVAGRRAEISAGLQALQMGQPGRAEGRPRAPVRRGLVRQPQPVARAGPSGRRARPAVRAAVRIEPRRSLDRVRATSPHGRRIRPTIRRRRSRCARKRACTTASRSRSKMSSSRSTRSRRPSPRYAAYYNDVEKAEKTGERQVTFRFKAKNNRELPHIISQMTDPAEALVGGQGRQRRAARHHEVVAGGAARLRPLQGQVVRYRPRDRLRAGQGLVGEGPARAQGPVQFRRMALIYFRENASPRSRRSKSGALDYWVENSAKSGRSISRAAGQEGLDQAHHAGAQARHADAGLLPEHCARRCSRTRACAAPSISPSISSSPTRTCSTASTRAPTATSTIRSSRRRDCRRGANSRSSTR